MKKKYNNIELVKDLPKEFQLFMQHLQGMCFEDTPDYPLLFSLMEDMYRKFGGDENTVYDWERDKNSSPSHPRYAAPHSYDSFLERPLLPGRNAKVVSPMHTLVLTTRIGCCRLLQTCAS